MSARDEIARFIEDEGHRVEVSAVDGERDLSEIVFRSRGQMFSVAISELDPTRLRISTAYEIPDWVRDRHHALGALGDVEREYREAHFTLAHDDTIFVATLDYDGPNVQAFLSHFWEIVGRLRDAGTAAIERMVDRSESKAAADKFIRQFMKGERQ
ncbi:MAG: hypothetical protein JO199_14885 [Candidatus Eremiobacteraeota bacterium]|nr:hypothetical protein [Candidatus Eremiobacteraeota bacterium]